MQYPLDRKLYMVMDLCNNVCEKQRQKHIWTSARTDFMTDISSVVFHSLHQLFVSFMLRWLGVNAASKIQEYSRVCLLAILLARESDIITINCPSTAHMGSVL